MPLTQEQEEREHELRVDQMTINIEKMRNDMRWETRKFVVSIVVGAAACVAAGVGLANYVNNRSPFAGTPQPAPVAAPK